MAFKPKYLVLHDYGTNNKYKGGDIEFNPYHALVRGGEVQYRYPGNPYGQKAPHAYHLNPQALGLSWYGPVGGQPGEKDFAALQAEYKNILAQFPDIKVLGHGEAYAQRGHIPQASKHGRDLEEASWRTRLLSGGNEPQLVSGPTPAKPPMALGGPPRPPSSMNGGMGMAPTGTAGVSGPAQLQNMGRESSNTAIDPRTGVGGVSPAMIAGYGRSSAPLPPPTSAGPPRPPSTPVGSSPVTTASIPQKPTQDNWTQLMQRQMMGGGLIQPGELPDMGPKSHPQYNNVMSGLLGGLF